MPFNSLLILSDLSIRSDRAVRRGLGLAASHGAKVTLFSVVDDGLPEDVQRYMKDKATAHLTAAAKAEGEGVACEIVVETGDPMALLLQVINRPGFDLVVAGRHRARGLLDGIRPTTIEKLVSCALAPVLIASEQPFTTYEKVLAPVAFTPVCQGALEQARALVPDAEFRLLHVWSVPFGGMTGGPDSAYAGAIAKETQRAAQDWHAGLKGDFPEVTLVVGGAAASVYHVARSFKPNLIAVGTHTRGLSFTGLGSLTAELMRDPVADLLIAGGRAG